LWQRKTQQRGNGKTIDTQHAGEEQSSALDGMSYQDHFSGRGEHGEMDGQDNNIPGDGIDWQDEDALGSFGVFEEYEMAVAFVSAKSALLECIGGHGEEPHMQDNTNQGPVAPEGGLPDLSAARTSGTV
jgi:hypothetical protein